VQTGYGQRVGKRCHASGADSDGIGAAQNVKATITTPPTAFMKENGSLNVGSIPQTRSVPFA